MKLLPAMREVCGEFYILQQGTVPAHRVRQTINLLEQDTCVRFTRPSATQQYRSGPRWLQNIRNEAAGLASSWRRWTEAGLNWSISGTSKASSIDDAVGDTLISGANVSAREFVQKEDLFSITPIMHCCFAYLVC